MIALLMSVTFLFPVMSWAFEVQSYTATPEISDAAEKLKSPAQREYALPDNIGTVMSADMRAGAPTLILIQDLHCNYEVQTHIRQILGSLKARHPELDLIAVEGATGIVPSRELAALPDSDAKRAVTAYFMREGKITGADAFVICDQPQVELFGAEDPDLYQRSLKLAETFTGDENAARIQELTGQIAFLRARVYNRRLLAFEHRREMAEQGRMGVYKYHAALARDAQRLMGTEAAAVTDLQDRVLQDRMLERRIRERLFVNDRERRLFAAQQYVEIAERILAVSASQEDLRVFQDANAKLDLAGIQKSLQRDLVAAGYPSAFRTASAQETTELQAALQQGLKFYQLAEQRNRALWERTLARARALGKQRVILITGGFHTRSIGRFAQQQGFSTVCIRPRQYQTETATAYFQLLQNPNQKTDLENMLATLAAAEAALAVVNFLTSLEFRKQFRQAVQTAQAALALSKGKIARTGERYFSREADNTIRVRVPGTEKEYHLSVEQGELFIGRTAKAVNDARAGRFAGSSKRTVWQLPIVRISGLILLASGIGFMAGVVFLGMPVAASMLPLVVGMTLLGAWAAVQPNSMIMHFSSRRGIICLAIMLGLLLLSAGMGTFLSDLVTQAAASPNSPLHGLFTIVKPILSAMHLTVYQHSTTQASAIATQITDYSQLTAFHPSLQIGMGLASFMIGTVNNSSSGKDTLDMMAALQETQLLRQEESNTGKPYEANEARPAEGYTVIFPEKKEQELRDILRAIGLSNLADLLRFEVYRETRDKLKYIYAPIKSNVVRSKLWIIREAIKDYDPQDMRRINLEYIRSHIDPEADGELNYAMPRIKITDLATINLESRLTKLLRDLDPASMHEAISATGTNWNELYREIVDEQLRGHIQIALENSSNIKISNAPKAEPKQAEKYIQDGAAHEVAHFVAGYFTPEMEMALFSIFNRLTEDPLYHKNMSRALMAIKKYREEKNIQTPNKQTTQLMLFMFVNEMACDYLALYFMEKAGRQHMYTDYGISIPADLQEVFDKFLAGLQEMDRKKTILLFSDKQMAMSRMIQAQKFMSGLGLMTKEKVVNAVSSIVSKDIIISSTESFKTRMITWLRILLKKNKIHPETTENSRKIQETIKTVQTAYKDDQNINKESAVQSDSIIDSPGMDIFSADSESSEMLIDTQTGVDILNPNDTRLSSYFEEKMPETDFNDLALIEKGWQAENGEISLSNVKAEAGEGVGELFESNLTVQLPTTEQPSGVQNSMQSSGINNFSASESIASSALTTLRAGDAARQIMEGLPTPPPPKLQIVTNDPAMLQILEAYLPGLLKAQAPGTTAEFILLGSDTVLTELSSPDTGRVMVLTPQNPTAGVMSAVKAAELANQVMGTVGSQAPVQGSGQLQTWTDAKLMETLSQPADMKIVYAPVSQGEGAAIRGMATAVASMDAVQGKQEFGSGIVSLGGITVASGFNESAEVKQAAEKTRTKATPEIRAVLSQMLGENISETEAETLINDNSDLKSRLVQEQVVLTLGSFRGKQLVDEKQRQFVVSRIRSYLAPKVKAQYPFQVKAVGERVKEVSTTAYLQMRGAKRILSAIALGYAVARLSGEALKDYAGGTARNINRIREIPIFTVILPTFVKALRIMMDIVLGRFGANQVADPYLLNQLEALKKLATEVNLAEKSIEQIPAETRRNIPYLLWLQRILTNPWFKMIVRLQGLDPNDLNPELYLLIRYFQDMKAVGWYFAPGSFIQNQLNTRSDLPKNLVADLGADGNFQHALRQLDKNPGQWRMSKVMRLLIQKLDVKDATAEYRLGVLRILSIMDPTHQTVVQAYDTDVDMVINDAKLTIVYLPTKVLETPILLEGVLKHFVLYYQNGKKVLAPIINRIVSAARMA